MANNELKKSYSAFTNNTELNRANQVRRDNDNVKIPKVTLEDIDWAMMSYIRDVIKPTVIENGQKIDVPLMWANGETWAQVQSKGYMRDRKGKIMTPLISIRRTAIAERDSLKKLDVNRNPSGNSQVLQNKFTTVNRYDRFSLTRGKQRLKEFYVTSIPEYIDVTYELLLWCEYTEQMNSVIEQIMPTGGFAWGTTWKFPTFISDYSFETVNASGEDRIVRATLPLTTKATLLMSDELRKSTIEKRYSIKRVHFASETEKFDVDVTNAPPEGYNNTHRLSENQFQKNTGLENSTNTDQGVRSENIRSINGISDLSDRPHAKE